MYVPFDKMPGQSRIWIYQTDRELTTEEVSVVSNEIKKFCEGWVAHSNPLQTSFAIKYNHFLILAVNEQTNGASGCSIDSSVHTLKSLQSRLNIDFFGRLKIAILTDGAVKTFSLNEEKEKINFGEMSSAVLTFNNLVTTKEELSEKWIVPISRSWLARHLPKGTLA